ARPDGIPSRARARRYLRLQARLQRWSSSWIGLAPSSHQWFAAKQCGDILPRPSIYQQTQSPCPRWRQGLSYPQNRVRQRFPDRRIHTGCREWTFEHLYRIERGSPRRRCHRHSSDPPQLRHR
ncbi:hypothetical protein AB1N83_011780, partial [Pleurotus pulmonarius]